MKTDREMALSAGVVMSCIVLVGVILTVCFLLFGCRRETVREVSQDPYPQPQVVNVPDGYNAQIFAAGAYAAQASGYSTDGNPCCGSNFSLSVSQSGTDIGGDQSQNVNTGSGDVNDIIADTIEGGGGGGGEGQWVGGAYAYPIEDWGPPGGTPIEIVDGNGQWYLGVARDDLGGPNIPIDVSAPNGDVLTGYQSRRSDAGNTTVLTYIAADGESVEKVVLKNQEWLDTGTAQY